MTYSVSIRRKVLCEFSCKPEPCFPGTMMKHGSLINTDHGGTIQAWNEVGGMEGFF